jgi:hypothetical protein
MHGSVYAWVLIRVRKARVKALLLMLWLKVEKDRLSG